MFYQNLLATVQAWLADSRPETWIVQKVQNRLDMQNVHVSIGSLTFLLTWLEQMAAKEKLESSGGVVSKNAISSSIAGRGTYDG